MIKYLKKLGPGLLFAGSAVGVSHLVQSTKAGANFGFGLIWALVLINIIKFPFFEFGPRYAAATGENLLEGYKKLGKVFLNVYIVLSFTTMFTIHGTLWDEYHVEVGKLMTSRINNRFVLIKTFISQLKHIS